jgi:two-component system, OmpR family, phosphate regulon sensor histidine kinase PhoR
MNDLGKLSTLITEQRDALLSRWRQEVKRLPSAKHLDTPTLNDHIPALLDELADAFRASADETETLVEENPSRHGAQRLKDGFDIVEVVAEYNILRGCLHDLAEANGIYLAGRGLRVINRVLDEAIGLAVSSYATHQAREVQQRRDEYLTFVAHDLRTPLSAISLATKVLERTLADGAQGSEPTRMLHSLHRNVQQLETLVAKVLKENENLQTETGVKLEQREFDLWPLVEALVHDLHPVAGTASTELINNVPDDLVVYADASLLRRVLQNLIANAIRYTSRGEVVIAACEIADGIECSVTDNGAGIAADLIEKVFDKSATDAKDQGGHGLGLAIVKTFVETHGGKVGVESKPGKGSRFWITLPGKAQPAGSE